MMIKNYINKLAKQKKIIYGNSYKCTKIIMSNDLSYKFWICVFYNVIIFVYSHHSQTFIWECTNTKIYYIECTLHVYWDTPVRAVVNKRSKRTNQKGEKCLAEV